MTIRETSPLQKKIHCFSLIKNPSRVIGLLILLSLSCPLFAQEDTTINTSDFEEIKPETKKVADKIDETLNTMDEVKASPQADDPIETIQEANKILDTDETNQETMEQNVVSLPNGDKTFNGEVIETTMMNVAEKEISALPSINNKKWLQLEQKFSTQQNLIQQLSKRLDELSAQNQDLSIQLSDLQLVLDKQSKQTTQILKTNHPKLKAQLIQLAIQTSQLKPEVVSVKEAKQEQKKEGAWYEKLVVVKKIEKKPETKQSTTPLYAVLKQFDLLQLALESNNQEQWQSTIGSITTTLSTQYPTHAQSIVQQLKALQTQNITDSANIDNTVVDEKFGIK